MIDYQLKPCCNECNHVALSYEQATIESWNLCFREYQKTVIFCDHQIVCGKYNEVEYHNEVE